MIKIISSLGSLYDLDDTNMTVKAILGLHAFTGCDNVSAFCGKGKIKPFKILLKNRKYIMTFPGIGLTTDLTEEQLDVLQEFVCDIYGHKSTCTNDLRFKLYCSKQGKLEAKSIPLCLDCLKLHSRRASFQAFVWRQCLVPKPIIPSPLDHGWKMVEDEIAIKWNTIKPAPEEVLALMFCTCSKKCVAETCPCIGNGLFSTDPCTKTDCQNYINEDINDEQNEADETEDEDEDSEYESWF